MSSINLVENVDTMSPQRFAAVQRELVETDYNSLSPTDQAVFSIVAQKVNNRKLRELDAQNSGPLMVEVTKWADKAETIPLWGWIAAGLVAFLAIGN